MVAVSLYQLMTMTQAKTPKKKAAQKKKVTPDRGGVRLNEQGSIVNGGPGKHRPSTWRRGEPSIHRAYFRYGETLRGKLKTYSRIEDVDFRPDSDLILNLIESGLVLEGAIAGLRLQIEAVQRPEETLAEALNRLITTGLKASEK